MVAPSSAKPSFLRHSSRTYHTFSSPNATATVVLPDSRVTLSKWKYCFAAVANVASSNRQSAAHRIAPCFGMSTA
eukprot:3339668-Amphidinium_carterae.1